MGKKQTAGERIVRTMEHRNVNLSEDGRAGVARAIDSAIRRAVKEAYDTGHSAAWQRAAGNLAGETSRKNIIEKKYGVKL